MAVIEERLAQLGLDLPAVFSGPPGMTVKFDLVRLAGDVAYISGHGPTDGPRVLMRGKIGDHLASDWLSQKAGWEAARLTALAMLASLKAEVGDLDPRVRLAEGSGVRQHRPRLQRHTGGYQRVQRSHPRALGRWRAPFRSAIGVAELPLDMRVEVEAIVTVRPVGMRSRSS